MLVPDRAIGTDQDRKFVLVVGADRKAMHRPVRIGGVVDGERIVNEGLREGERVVVNGLLRVRPGQEVNARSEPAPSPGTEPPTGVTPGSANAAGKVSEKPAVSGDGR